MSEDVSSIDFRRLWWTLGVVLMCGSLAGACRRQSGPRQLPDERTARHNVALRSGRRYRQCARPCGLYLPGPRGNDNNQTFALRAAVAPRTTLFCTAGCLVKVTLIFLPQLRSYITRIEMSGTPSDGSSGHVATHRASTWTPSIIRGYTLHASVAHTP